MFLTESCLLNLNVAKKLWYYKNISNFNNTGCHLHRSASLLVNQTNAPWASIHIFIFNSKHWLREYQIKMLILGKKLAGTDEKMLILNMST